MKFLKDIQGLCQKEISDRNRELMLKKIAGTEPIMKRNQKESEKKSRSNSRSLDSNSKSKNEDEFVHRIKTLDPLESPFRVKNHSKIEDREFEFTLSRKNSIQPGKSTAVSGMRSNKYKINVHKVFEQKQLMDHPLRKVKTKISSDFKEKVCFHCFTINIDINKKC